jgi:hypothetical protein
MSTPADKRIERYQITCAKWRGITLEIRHCPLWSKVAEIDHFEVVCKDRQVLPITETGYRSLFIRPEYIEAHGSAQAYVLGWLEEEAKSPEWTRKEANSKQLSLF